MSMPSVRQRPTSTTTTNQPSTSPPPAVVISPNDLPQQSSGALSQTLTGAANLANLLPTGTLLAFQLLTPLFTNNGACDPTTRLLAHSLLFLLALSCFLACFTDTVKTSDGRVYHGIATFRGMWVFDYPDPFGSGLPDLSRYRMRAIDWVHAILSVMVFCAVALRDRNVVSCLYPSPADDTKQVLNIVPMGVGVMCSLLFVVFPTTRHGIGFPLTPGK